LNQKGETETKIGEAKGFFLIAKGTSAEELFIGGSDATTDDVLAAWRHTSLEEVDEMKKQIAQHYIRRGESVPPLMTVRIEIKTQMS